MPSYISCEFPPYVHILFTTPRLTQINNSQASGAWSKHGAWGQQQRQLQLTKYFIKAVPRKDGVSCCRDRSAPACESRRAPSPVCRCTELMHYVISEAVVVKRKQECHISSKGGSSV